MDPQPFRELDGTEVTQSFPVLDEPDRVTVNPAGKADKATLLQVYSRACGAVGVKGAPDRSPAVLLNAGKVGPVVFQDSMDHSALRSFSSAARVARASGAQAAFAGS